MFSAREIDALEAAANELQTMCLAAAQHVIDTKRYADLTIPADAIPLIEQAWNAEPPALYGRFDVMYDGSQPPKLLEYNADTPTSLMEAAVVQWTWLQDVAPDADQFNSLHERLIAKWRDIAPYLQQPVHFASADTEEDVLTVVYLRDTAEQAGLKHSAVADGRDRLGQRQQRLRRPRKPAHPHAVQAVPVGKSAK